MIGLKIKRKQDGARFTITGHDGRHFILTPDDFGPVEAVPLAGLVADYGVKPDAVTVPPTEAELLRARDAEANRTINATYARALLGGKPPRPRPTRPPAGSPEDAFRKIAEDDK